MKAFHLSLLLIISACVHGLVHHLTIYNDDRNVFKIETFGFLSGGKMDISITNFDIKLTKKEKTIFTSNTTEVSIVRRLANATVPIPPAAGGSSSTPAATAPVATTPVASAPVATAPVATTPVASAPVATAPVATAPVTTPVTTSPAKPTPPVATAPTTPTAPAAPVTPVVPAPVKTPAKSPPKTGGKNSTHDPIVYKVGFVMRRAESESTAQQDLEKIIENGLCIFDHLEKEDVVIGMNNVEKWKHLSVNHVVDEEGAGLYSLIFARCIPSGSHLVSFKMDATFYNPGPNYLSAGDTPLPTMYFSFFIIFSIALGVWLYILRRDPTTYGTVHHIHYMMLILLGLKVASLLFESVRYHYIAMYGVSETWSVVYYIFAFLKGVMLFTVILLIGSGWSLMKSYLSGQEKKIIFVVLILQVLDNIAMIILEESAPGSQGWLTWRDILHLVDIICCVAILLPIVWSIRHLRLAAEVDGKAHNSLVKLQLFRQFYVMVVVYIYFTRIVVYLIASTVSFHLLWLGPFSTEAATFLFYVITGFKFRPALDNPYLAVRTEDLEGGDYGLEEEPDDGVEMQLK